MLPRPKAYRFRDLIDLLGSIYGIATSTLVLILIPSGMDSMTFAKAVTILLSVIGSLLVVDGLLSARTGIDRTLNVVRHGWTARLVGVFKAIAGMAALCWYRSALPYYPSLRQLAPYSTCQHVDCLDRS
jgi:hypothetical protein